MFKREKAAEGDAVSIADTATLVEPASSSSRPHETDPRNLTGGQNYTNSVVYAEVNSLMVTDNTYCL
ncbi:hypothetical protein IWW42_001691 [Coemansia sp. RSA 1085]|nr:hypothetical protein IWW42_001691 [Coemansia sp. RSA 1085]